MMKLKFFLLLLLAWLGSSAMFAQVRYPKREFRGAWIQCVNGQFQGMPTAKMQQTLIQQLDNLQKAGTGQDKRYGCLVAITSCQPLSESDCQL